ncbi:MAG TPA: hypothetical protein VM286_07990 [Candidatus Thermoplasmatota archaeon]|nr:hypothetical protein [Candidatus Thermoplasmatota archaeon]
MAALPPAPAWRRLDWASCTALFAAALALRWPFLDAVAYGDEAMHYYMASHLLQGPSNLSDVFGILWFHPSWIVFQRPFYYLLFHPAAMASFHAFRVQNAILGSLLPVVSYGLLRTFGVRRPFAIAAGLAAASFPLLVVWGTFGLMDTAMTVFLLAGLWARSARRPILSAVLLLAATWSKETAYVAVVALFTVTQLRTWWRKDSPVWPLRFDAAQSALAVVMLVGLVPVLLSSTLGLRTPGAPASGYAFRLIESLFGASLLVPVLFLGLRWPASRTLATWALAAGGFLLALHVVLHRAVEVWYNVPAVALGFVGVAATVDAAWTASAHRRWVPSALAVFVGLVVVGAVLVPGSAAKDAILHPFEHIPSGSWSETLAYEKGRDRDLTEAQVWVDARHPTTLLAFDVEYPHVLHPFVEGQPRVVLVSSQLFDLLPYPLHTVATAMAQPGTLTLLQVRDWTLNHGVQEVYSSCVVERNPGYILFDGSSCGDRGTELEARVPYPQPST